MAKAVFKKKAELPGWAATVQRSAHKYFWDMIYSCPKPPNAKSDKFYESLAWFFMHLIDKSKISDRRNIYNETVVTYTYMRAHEKMRYALVRWKAHSVQAWLDKRVDRTRYDYVKGIARKYTLNKTILSTFTSLCVEDEPMYNLMKPLRRRPIYVNEKDLVESSFRTSIKPKPFVRPENFSQHRGRSSELITLINKAQKNQRPYRFYLDRFLDIMKNAKTNRKDGLHFRLDIFLKRVCKFGFKLVNDDPNDRLVEFYDIYKMNPTGSRLFGTAAAMPKLVKLLCFDHSYGRNFDMPNAQMVLLIELLAEYGLECPELEALDHDAVAKYLKISRGTAKTLNYGGIYSGWSNRQWFRQHFESRSDDEQPRPVKTDIYRQLCSDPKIQRVAEKNKFDDKELADYVDWIWDRWKKLFEPAGKVVSELCDRIRDSSYCRGGEYHFKNSVQCSHSVKIELFNKDKYTVLSHYVQGQESYNLLKILAETEWCSAEFDGAILLTDYKGDVELKEKPFMTPTLNSLLFMRLWENSLRMGTVRRNLFTKRGFSTDIETVNREYQKIVSKLQ